MTGDKYVALGYYEGGIVFQSGGVLMSAIGLYIKELRVARGFSQEDFSQLIDLSKRQLIRIEKGEFNIKVSNLLKAIEILKAPITHIQKLIDTPETSESEVRLMVQSLLDQSTINQATTLVSEVQAEGKLAEALDIIQRLEAMDPAALDRLLGYGYGLLDRDR